MEQDFHGDFQVLVTWFFASFSGVLDWMVLILVWFERSLHSTQVSEESCPWPLKLMTLQRVERTWIHTGGYGRFRGEWVNIVYTTASKRFVIFTCRDFKLSWNATALIQSNCRNFSCNSHKRTDIVTLNKQLLISELFFTTCFSSRNFIPLEYGGPQLSRQKQKHHSKTKNLTAKTKYLIAKPSTSQQRQNSFGFAVGICFCCEVFGFCWGLWFYCEVFGFVVRYFVFVVRFSWGFCFWREVFGFAVRYFVFAVRFLVLSWQFWATVLKP